MEKALFEKLATAVGQEYADAVNERAELINDVIRNYDFEKNGFGIYDFDGTFEGDSDTMFNFDDMSKSAQSAFRVFVCLLNDKIESMYIDK